jgi:delta(3,5)-delta(2,4)-dienoyl-CoA isomerase
MAPTAAGGAAPALPAKVWSVLSVTRPAPHVVHVELNRPKQGNAMNAAFWREYRECFRALGRDPSCRAIVVSGAGKFFSVGLDIKEQGVGGLTSESNGEGGAGPDVARKAWKNRALVLDLQQSFTAMEECPQPVIVAAHNAVIGGAIDLLCAADIRLCTADAFFSIKEVDIGLAADVGTLQRLHHVMGNNSLARELCYTARRMGAEEAKQAGFVSAVFPTREAMLAHALDMAKQIASKSPVAIAGTKINLNFSRENKVKESLEFMATWNSAMLQTEDVLKAAMASLSKADQPDFSKL